MERFDYKSPQNNARVIGCADDQQDRSNPSLHLFGDLVGQKSETTRPVAWRRRAWRFDARPLLLALCLVPVLHLDAASAQGIPSADEVGRVGTGPRVGVAGSPPAPVVPTLPPTVAHIDPTGPRAAPGAITGQPGAVVSVSGDVAIVDLYGDGLVQLSVDVPSSGLPDDIERLLDGIVNLDGIALPETVETADGRVILGGSSESPPTRGVGGLSTPIPPGEVADLYFCCDADGCYPAPNNHPFNCGAAPIILWCDDLGLCQPQ